MTAHRDLEKIIRDRQSKTVESYTAARVQQAIEMFCTNMAALISKDFNWSVMQPVFMKVYRESFSQSEVNAMIAFYGSPAGHRVLRKLPLVFENSMNAMQQRLQSLMPEIQQMGQQMVDQIKARKAAEDKHESS